MAFFFSVVSLYLCNRSVLRDGARARLISERHAHHDRVDQRLRAVVVPSPLRPRCYPRCRNPAASARARARSRALVGRLRTNRSFFCSRAALSSVRAFERRAVGQFALGVDRLARVFGPPAAEDIVVLEREPKRVDPAVATRARRVGAVLRQLLAERRERPAPACLLECWAHSAAAAEAGCRGSRRAATCRAGPGWCDAGGTTRPARQPSPADRRAGCLPAVRSAAAAPDYWAAPAYTLMPYSTCCSFLRARWSTWNRADRGSKDCWRESPERTVPADS